ncbi:MAG: hypothetical protein KKG76_06720 [Euryarchaeota archaeon]|nr:hypothetical protein [Euryarchaeota archaeon]MBU4139366.1 hypothetical protein [Euryarchaeota archaeon]
MLQDYVLDTLVYIGIYAILAISLNLEAGYTRLMNFGKVAFFAIGAYTSALLSMAEFAHYSIIIMEFAVHVCSKFLNQTAKTIYFI